MARIDDMPESVRPALRRLARRLALGVFLDVWPAWAIASLLAAGSAALICRLFFPGMPHRHIMRELELISKEVMPAFK